MVMIWTNQCVSGCALHADAPPFSLSLISLSQPLPFTMAASSKRHHKSAIAAYLGNSAPLPVSDLPTSRDLLKQCLLLREQNPKDEAAFTVPQMATEAASLAIPVWHRANAKLALPPVCVEKPLLARRLEWKWKLLASIVSKRKVHRRTKAKFEAELDRVFDILTCQCPSFPASSLNAMSLTARPPIFDAHALLRPKFLILSSLSSAISVKKLEPKRVCILGNWTRKKRPARQKRFNARKMRKTEKQRTKKREGKRRKNFSKDSKTWHQARMTQQKKWTSILLMSTSMLSAIFNPRLTLKIERPSRLQP